MFYKKLSKNFSNHFVLDIKLGYKHQQKVILSLIVFLYYKRYKINLKRGGSYIDSPSWIKNKKATINPINDDKKCFQYTATVILNNTEIGKNSQTISKLSLL